MLKALGVIFLIIIGLGVFGGIASSVSRTKVATAVPATTATPARPAVPTRPYSERLAEAVKLLAEYDFTTDVETVDDIATSLAMIDVFASEAAIRPTTDADKTARTKYLADVRAMQRRVLPQLRDLYGPALRQKLWEADGKAKTIGNGYRTVEFVAAEFAANRNIKSMHETMYPSLMQLRFTRAQYKWFDLATEYSYYELKPPADGEIVTWSGARFMPIAE